MRRCPFCAEEIQDAAVKCRFCGSVLAGQQAAPPPDVNQPVSPQVPAPRAVGNIDIRQVSNVQVTG